MTRFHTFKLAIGLSLCAAVWLAPDPTSAQKASQRLSVSVDINHAELIRLAAPATSILVANPEIADIQIPDARSFIILGKKSGLTTIYALMAGQRTITYDVVVRRDAAEIRTALLRAVPEAHVTVTPLPNGYAIDGEAPTPGAAQKLKAIASQFLVDKERLVFNVGVTAATQISLRVRVAEVSRIVSKQFGFNWSALFNNGSFAFGLLTGRTPVSGFGNFTASPSGLNSLGGGYRSASGSVNISSLIDALASENLVTILAEPNLTAISGETANFLAGGEFPVPVAQGNNLVTIEFKRFGVSVAFTPTVVSADRINIRVRPEVSELSDRGAVVVDNIRVPGLAVRRAETTIEMASGQSFAIAGLFQNNASTQIERFPWLGDIPVLGTLFRSDRFQRDESELVIIVTPYIVRPAADPSQLRIPTDDLTFSSDIERILLGRLTSERRRDLANPPRLRGNPGFMVE